VHVLAQTAVAAGQRPFSVCAVKRPRFPWVQVPPGNRSSRKQLDAVVEDFDYAPPDCESSRVAQIRIATEVAEICRSQAGRRIAISSHGNVIGLLLNSLDAAFHRPHKDQLRNPNLLRLLYANSELRWDKGFKLAGLDPISTERGATPVDRH